MKLLTCVLLANEFFTAFELLHNHDQLESEKIEEDRLNQYDDLLASQRLQEGDYRTTGIASIVNLAFATELYCKALLFATKGVHEKNLHDTFRIFNKLPKDEQQALVNMLIANNAAPDEQTVHKRIDFNGTAFNRFRYFHEKDMEQYQITFAVIFAGCLKKRLKPHFARAIEELVSSK